MPSEMRFSAQNESYVDATGQRWSVSGVLMHHPEKTGRDQDTGALFFFEGGFDPAKNVRPVAGFQGCGQDMIDRVEVLDGGALRVTARGYYSEKGVYEKDEQGRLVVKTLTATIRPDSITLTGAMTAEIIAQPAA